MNTGANKKPAIRDAATLIIVRSDDGMPRFIMGKRHESSVFMPGKFVFPGGRVDACDSRVRPANQLHPKVEKSLINRMRGTPSTGRARGLAMAAIRETFEEVGLIIGSPTDRPNFTKSPQWRPFAKAGFAPALDQLRFLARAITPPGRPRRFDARFFVVEADAVANLDKPVAVDNDELLECHWVSFDDAKGLELPYITQLIVKLLKQRLETGRGLAPGDPVPFQYFQRGKWHNETV